VAGSLSPAVGSLSPAAGSLSAREMEIATWVGRGATNREIAAGLYISPKTVAAHVEHIRAKLGFSRRTQIAAWIVTHGEP
jgi:DNA-binding CsgD family transcriptional regulator